MKTTQLSTRVTPEDAAFLAGLVMEGATTPSDKLRGLIGEARRRREELGDYQGSLRQIRELLGPVSAKILAVENDGLPHSEVVTPVVDWLVEALAFVLSTTPDGEASPDACRAQVRSLEAGLVERAFRLVQSMLKLGITDEAPCYEPKVVEVPLSKSLRVAQVVASARAVEGAVTQAPKEAG